MANPVINTKKHQPAAHGGGVRGDNSAARSALFEGRFGRLFRSLPAAEWPKDALLGLGRKITSDPEVEERDPRLPSASLETDKRVQDDEENAGILSGYTYLGQFIDHDITFDPASSLQQHNDPNALVDFRTPSLDLDSLYGHGPADQPYLYDGNKFRLGRPLFENDKPTNVRDHCVCRRSAPAWAHADCSDRCSAGGLSFRWRRIASDTRWSGQSTG
jgi:hypothetical protein